MVYYDNRIRYDLVDPFWMARQDVGGYPDCSRCHFLNEE